MWLIERAQVVTVKNFVIADVEEDERISIELVRVDVQAFFGTCPYMMTFLRKLTRNRLLTTAAGPYGGIRHPLSLLEPEGCTHTCVQCMHTPDRELFKVSSYDSYQNSRGQL